MTRNRKNYKDRNSTGTEPRSRVRAKLERDKDKIRTSGERAYEKRFVGMYKERRLFMLGRETYLERLSLVLAPLLLRGASSPVQKHLV